uniref:Uncharacterized protein n=1 Tax=Salmonella phage vB_SEnST11_KE22 TaxID=3161173 RepID=A0AAU8GFM6_9CAUD
MLTRLVVNSCWLSHLENGDMFLFKKENEPQTVWVKGYSESHVLTNPDRKVKNCECVVIPLY